ncbi:MAG: cytochrome-c peroxidase [Bacteroidetes bacterium]|nr:cytochrome-c peroxidase [Bacteroidota bacterium]
MINWKSISVPIFGTLIPLMVFVTCKKNTQENYSTTPYNLEVPTGFPSPYLSSENPLTVEGIALGKKLFYDSILSSNGRSCNTCHLQEKSFMRDNAELKLDPAFYNNIPALINQAWNKEYGWTGVETNLDHVAIGDFGPMFFNSDMDKVLQRLHDHAQYPDMFHKAFPNVKDPFQNGVLQARTAMAIAQFLRTIISSDSKFDRVRKGTASFTAEETYGMEIFGSEKGDCFHCHSYPLFQDNSYHNIGLDNTFNGLNKGRYFVTQKSSDLGKFSTPGLRNLSYTAPYMHDGRFNTLDEVIEHYNSGVKYSSTLDPIMTKPGKETGLNLSSFDKYCLKQFLLTLTDSSIITNINYSKSP